MTSKLQVVCDAKGRPLLLHLSEGQTNDHKTAAAIIEHLPPARFLLADRAYSSVAFRQALAERNITPCIPPHAKHRVQHSYDPILLPPAPQNREPVRTPQGLASHPHKVRPMCSHLPVSNRLCSSLHLLDQ